MLKSAVSVSLLFLVQGMAVSQELWFGAPFLLTPTSPEANAMGGIGSSMISDNAMAMMENPGQLGLQNLGSFFRSSVYTRSAVWLPTYYQQDETFNSIAFSGGVNLQKAGKTAFPLSVGLGYSHESHDY